MAERTINTRLAIKGESEYRAAITGVNTELRTLRSSLELAESTMRTNGESVQTLSAKHEALSALWMKQSEKVEKMREALDNAKQAVQTHAAAVEAARQKYEASKADLDKLREAGSLSAKEEREMAKAVEENRRALETEEAMLKAAEKGAQDWTVSINKGEVELNRLSAEMKESSRQLDDFGEGTEKNADALDALAANLAASGITGGLEKLREALQSCVDASASFEAAMSGVGAIANASGAEMDMLTEKAQQIGAATMFTASQAAEAMNYMAMAGWNAQEMLSGVDGVINLAAASGENLGMVSDIVTDALTAFGLTASDTAHFVDVLAQTAASSNTNVSILGESFKYAAPLAGALGYSVEDVAVAMGLMANNGIKGSQAGTTLRTMFTKLSGEVTLTGDAFEEVTISAANADGTMKPLSQTLEELRGYFSQMTQAEKLANAEAVAGRYAMSGLTALMNTTDEDFQSLTASISDCAGAAERMAKVRMDNLEGQVTLMKSAFDALQIAVGDDLNPALRDLAETGTDVLTWAAEFVEAHENLVPVIAAVAAGITTLAGAVTTVVAVKKLAIPVMELFNGVMAANPALLVATAVATLIAVIGTLAVTMNTTSEDAKALNDAVGDMRDAFDDADAEFESTQSSYAATADSARDLIDALYELEDEGLDTADAQARHAMIVDKLNALIPELNMQIDEQTGKVLQDKAAIEGLVEAWEAAGIQDAFEKNYNDKITAYNEAKVALVEAEIRSAQNEKDLKELSDEREKVVARIDELLDEMSTETDGEKYNAMQLELDEARAKVDEFDVEISHLKNDQDDLNDSLTDAQGALEEADKEVAVAKEAMDEFAESEEGLAEAAREAAEALAADYANALQEVKDAVDEVAAAFGEEYAAAYSALKQQIGLAGVFSNEVQEADKSAAELKKTWEDNAEALINYRKNLEYLSQQNLNPEIISEAADAGPGQVQALVEGLREGTIAADALNASFAAMQEQQRLAALEQALAVMDMEAAYDQLAEMVDSSDIDYSDFLLAAEEAFEQYGIDLDDLGGKWAELKEKIQENAEGSAEAVNDSMSGEELDGLADSAEGAAGAVDALAGSMGQLNDEAMAEVGELPEKAREAMEETTEAVETGTEEAGAALDEGTAQAVNDALAEYESMSAAIDAQLNEVKATIEGYQASMSAAGNGLGSAFVEGMTSGAGRAAGGLYAKIRSIVNEAVSAAYDEARVNSPSKRMIPLGEGLGEGVVVGLENVQPTVDEATRQMLDAAMTLKLPDVELNEPAIYTTAQMMLDGSGGTKERMDALSEDIREVKGLLKGILSATDGERRVVLDDGTIVGRWTKRIDRALGARV